MVTSAHQKYSLHHFDAFFVLILVYYQNSFDILPEITNLMTIHVPIIDFHTGFQMVFERIIWHYFVTDYIGGGALTRLDTMREGFQNY